MVLHPSGNGLVHHRHSSQRLTVRNRGGRLVERPPPFGVPMSDEVAITLISSLTGVLSTVLTIGIRRLHHLAAQVDKLSAQVFALRVDLAERVK